MKISKEKFLSCDWGTSSFRLRLVDAINQVTIAEESSSQGIFLTHELWKQTGKPKKNKLLYFQSFLHDQIKKIEEKQKCSLKELPLVISGMASSSIGMLELPYKEIPFCTDGSDLEIKTIAADTFFSHPTIIISGVKTSDDVMRGEETLLVGCFPIRKDENQVFIFPGTHSKHVTVKNGLAVGITTYMTGEYFELLSKKSILSASIEKGGDRQYDKNQESFKAGVLHGIETNLLHGSFLVRTNQLFAKFSNQENYFYLSGLLIGAELKDLKNNMASGLLIVGNKNLIPYYKTAILLLNLPGAVFVRDADEALIRGQLKICSNLDLL